MDTLICGDALQTLQTLPDHSIDLAITSPPYNKGGNSGRLVAKVEYTDTPDNLPEYEYQQNQIEVIDEMWRVVKPAGRCSTITNSAGRTGK